MDYQYGSQGSYCTEHQRFGYCSECQTIVIKKLLDKLFGVITYTLEYRISESKLPEDFIEI